MEKSTIDIYENLRHYRLLNNKKQSEVAAFLDIDESMYGKIERGESDITWSRLTKLSTLYNISVAKLCGQSIGHTITNGSNSPIVTDNSTNNSTNEPQTEALIKLTEGMLQLQNALLPIMQKVIDKL